MPYALPLAVTVGLLDLIPLVGAILGATLCAFVALSVGWPAAVILVVYFVVYQQLENHFLAPVIYSRTVAMSPLTVLLVSLAGAVLGGLVGVLIAIPLASAGSIAVGELLRSKGVEGLADLAEVITEGAPEEGPRAASATRRLLGAHVLGANAEEVINVFALAVRQGLTADQVAESVWAYPTSSSDIGCLV